MDVSRGSGSDVEVVQASRAARGGSRAAAGCVACAGAAVEHLLACLAEPSSSLARQLGWAGWWAGWWAPGKFSPVFLFLFIL